MNILLADDDKDDRFFFEKALASISIPTHYASACDGEQLMTYLSQNQEHLPDVIFLDLNMPRKNGEECLTQIKQDKKLASIPVVIYSTSLQSTVADTLYDAGAHYYLHKCSFAELKICLDVVLKQLTANPHQPDRHDFIINCIEV
ncbi:MAG: response regulator [Bacteroidetes bacterium]|nr:response regulator [Bacteroidota bacterium]